MFADVKKIYDNTSLDVFVMASTHLMTVGWAEAEKWTDEEISKVEGNGLMTAEFCQELCKIARDIAKASSPVEFIQLCQVVKLYDTKGLVKRKSK